MSEETERLIEAALSLSGYATHDNDCGANIGEPCDCGYSAAHQNLRDLIEAHERRSERRMDLSQDGELTPVKEEGQ